MRTTTNRNSQPLALEDMTLHEVTCSECGKPISSIPTWLATANVKFQCEECRQKHPRVSGMPEVEPRRTVDEIDELNELGEIVEEVEDEEVEDDMADETDDHAE